jgi:hypothetical protein
VQEGDGMMGCVQIATAEVSGLPTLGPVHASHAPSGNDLHSPYTTNFLLSGRCLRLETPRFVSASVLLIGQPSNLLSDD